MGSSAPRDPEFSVDYSVSPSDEAAATAKTCEPSFEFGDGVNSPTCEGWIDPHDGSRSDSIADLAHKASSCVNSIEKVCTIDAIDLYATPTDPNSPGWPCTGALRGAGGCPGGSTVELDTQDILDAGCRIAAATGGTWSGPKYFTCPNGTNGNLALETVGPNANVPNVDNPSLMKAFEEIGFGPEINPVVANGTDRAMFQFVPYGAIRVVPGEPFQSHCTRVIPVEKWNCDHDPDVITVGSTTVYGWNWSDTPGENYLLLGDIWSVTFLVYAASGPFGAVPVDACAIAACGAEHGNFTDGLYTWATYLAPGNHSRMVNSFPLSVLDILANAPPPPPPSPTPGIPTTPPASLAPGIPPEPPAVAVPSVIGAGAVPVQIAMLGLMAAGFTRISVRNRTVAMPMAMHSRHRRPTRSNFERDDVERPPPIGRFE